MGSYNRRQFIRLAAGSAIGIAVGACAPESGPPEAMTPTVAASTPAATAGASRTILRNDNVPGFYVRYYKPFSAVDKDRWSLSVEGLIGNPQKLAFADILELPRVSQVSRMKCVECWSAAARWEGFHIQSLLDIVQPKPEAQWVQFLCADGYYEAASLDTLMGERVLFVHSMNDQVLPDIYGAPLRLLIPSLYGYKSPKAIVGMQFSDKELVGYWPSVGPYTPDGSILPGLDHPLDLEGTRTVGRGEVVYPDGIESAGEGTDP